MLKNSCIASSQRYWCLIFLTWEKICFLVKVLNSSKIPCLKCEVCSTKSFGSSPVLLLLVFGWQCSGLMAEAGSVTAQRNYPPKMIWSKWFVSQEVLGGKCILQVLPQLIEDCGPQKIQDFRAWFFFFFLHMKYFELALPLIVSFMFLFEVLPPPEICPNLLKSYILCKIPSLSQVEF